MTTVIASTTTPPAGSAVGRSACTEHEVSVTFFDAAPDDYDPDVAAAFGSLAAQYEEIAAALFDDDPDLTSHIAPKSPGAA